MSRRSPELIRPDLPAGEVGAALAAAPEFAPAAAALGTATASYLDTLRALGAFDLTTARVIEPHLDALAILREAGLTPGEVLDGADAAAWGVYAARAPQLRAEERDGVWVLDGTKPWCSLGSELEHALVTAGTPQGQRLFAVRLDDPRVAGCDEPWVARGLAAVRSTSLTFDAMPATPVGEPGFYLGRDGFAWGGIGVAAVWAGAAQALAESVRTAATRREPDQIALMHIGDLDLHLHVIDVVLADAAALIDAGRAGGDDGLLLARRVRGIVARAAQAVITIVGQALGPAPLVGDETHARRVADLTVYLRQHHGERDLAALGSCLLPASPFERAS